MKKRIVIALGAVIFGSIFSIHSFAATQIKADKTITHLLVYKHFAVIRLSPALSGDELSEGCSVGGDAVVLNFDRNFGQDDDGEQTGELYSAILAAYMAGKSSIGFGVDGCRSGNGNNYPLVYRVNF